MAEYLTRIELHGADGAAYEKLHSEMLIRGFFRAVRGDDNVVYQLPTAEYQITSNSLIDEIIALARIAATTTRLNYSIITVEYSQARWLLPSV